MTSAPNRIWPLPEEPLARIVPVVISTSTMDTVVVPISMAQPTSAVSVGAVMSMQRKRFSCSSPFTTTWKPLSRRVDASFTITQ